MDDGQREAYSAFVASRWRQLVRSAVLLGCELHEAEDLTQATFLRCYLKWAQVDRADDRDAYVARVMLNLHRQSRRRRWWREVPMEEIPERQFNTPDVEATEPVRLALASLTREHREVVVLRVYLQLPERGTAVVLGIPPGTVKSRLSRALTRLAIDPGLVEMINGGAS